MIEMPQPKYRLLKATLSFLLAGGGPEGLARPVVIVGEAAGGRIEQPPFAAIPDLSIGDPALQRPIAVLVDREGLGDALLKLPFLRALGRGLPGLPVWWIATHQSAMAGPLRRFLPLELAEVREHAGLTEPAGEVARRLAALPPFSLVFDTRTRFASVRLARRFLRYDRFFCCLPGYLLSSARPPGRFGRPRHIGERSLSLAEAALGRRLESAGALACSDAAGVMARRLLPEGKTYVGLGIGSREVRKNWPLERHVALARQLVESGAAPVLLLGPQERDRAEEVGRLAPGAILLDFTRFPGEVEPLDGAIAIAQRLAVVVANDSGQGHLFGAAGRPIVSLFGPTDPRRWAPFAPALSIVRAQGFGGSAMALIPPEAVLEAVRRLLAAGGDSAAASPIPGRPAEWHRPGLGFAVEPGAPK
jgi:ADP-heptose:LPS heptosyltransferase